MGLLQNISKRLRSESNWIDVAQQIGIDVNDIDKIKRKNNCAAEFVYSLTNKIWNVLFEYVNINTNSHDYVTITNLNKVAQVLAGNCEIYCNNKTPKINILKEIAIRLSEWKKFARIIGLDDSLIREIERTFPSPDMHVDRVLEVMKKLCHPFPPKASWEFWRQYLDYFEDGRNAIIEIEIEFPILLTEITNTGVHAMATANLNYIGHPFGFRHWKSLSINKNAKSIAVPVGSGKFECIDFQDFPEWIKTQRYYMDKYDVLRKINCMDFSHPKRNFSRMLDTFKRYLEDKNDAGFVFKGYHYVDHICLFKSGLFAKDIFDDHYFCYIANDGVVLYITIYSKNKKDALYHSTRNVQIANLLHEELYSNEILQINVIAHKKDGDFEFCKTCVDDLLYVEEEVFESVETFSSWYEKIIHKRLHLRPNFEKNLNLKDDCSNIKSAMLTYEALENVAFPTFTMCSEDQINELKKVIVLTYIQLVALHSNNMHIVLRGPYGCGKSIVLQKRLESVITIMDKTDMCFLICNDQQSDFVYFLKMAQSKLSEKRVVVCQSKDIIPPLVFPKLSVILHKIKDMWPDRNVHVFLDEFSGSFFDEAEISTLERMLKSFSKSHIVVALQSMEEHAETIDAENPVDVGYHIALLTDKTSFSCFNLDYSLRCSNEINEFVKTTAKIIESFHATTYKVQAFQSIGKIIDKEYGMEYYKDLNNQAKHLSNTDQQSTFSTTTSYSYNQSQVEGHSVKSGPVNIYFFDRSKSQIPSNSVSMIYVTILKHVLREVSARKKYVVCTYDKHLYNSVCFYFEQMKYKWTNAIKTFIIPNGLFEILVTDYASVRGFEFENFIFLAPLGTQYLHYRILECITRATTNLSIIADSAPQQQNSFTIKFFSASHSLDIQLIREWKKLKSSKFHKIEYNASKDIIKISYSGSAFTLNNVKNIPIEVDDRFPWGKVFSWHCDGEKENGLLAVMKSLIIADDVELCMEFLKSNKIDFYSCDKLWKVNVLEMAIKYNASKLLSHFFNNYGLEMKFDFAAGNSLLDIAIRGENIDIIETLVKMLGKKDFDSQNSDSFYKMVNIIVKILIDKSTNIDSVDSFGNTALHLAVIDGYTSFVELLINKNANVNMKNFDGNTALLLSVKRHHKNITKFLIENNADITAKNNNGSSVMHVAIAYRNSTDFIKLLLDENVAIDAVNFNGDTALHLAVKNNLKDIIKLLIENNANIDKGNDLGDTAIHEAANYDHLDVIEYLLEQNAYIDAKNLNGNTPLHIATQNNSMQVVKFLINRNASINAINNKKETALHIAIRYRCLPNIEFLIKRKADVTLKDINGDTTLHIAVGNGLVSVAKWLIDNKVKSNETNAIGNTALHIALTTNQADLVSLIEIVELLIVHEADIFIENIQGSSPLDIAISLGSANVVRIIIKNNKEINSIKYIREAIKNGRFDIAKLLVEKCSTINEQDSIGNTALHIAANYCDIETACILVDRNADINSRNAFGNTPLHEAIKSSCNEIVNMLINRDGDVNAKNLLGNTALHYASYAGHDNILENVINKAEDVNVQNNNGITPIYIAVRNGYIDVVRSLLAKDADPDRKCSIDSIFNQDFSATNCIETINFSSQNYLDEKIKNNDGDTILHVAARNGNISMVNLLLNNSVNVNVTNQSDETPLHLAVLYKHIEITRKFVKCIDVNAKNIFGETALHFAASDGNTDIMKLLIDEGAKCNIQNDNGNTPLYNAVAFGNMNAVRFLIENNALVDLENNFNETPFHIATFAGDINILKVLLSRHRNYDSFIDLKASLIKEAKRYENVEMTEFLENYENLSFFFCNILSNFVLEK